MANHQPQYLNLTKLKARIAAQKKKETPGEASYILDALKAKYAAQRKKERYAELKAKYAAVGGKIISPKAKAPEKKLTPHPKNGQLIPPPAPKPGSFTETERALLLANVIQALSRRCNPDWSFKTWCKYELSRIYFNGDASWLSYSAGGACIYGPSKESIAYEIRCALGLKKVATRTVDK
jgi:hypothetical protein